MPIKPISIYRLSNDEHFVYMTEVKNLVETVGSSKLGVESIFHAFVKLYKEEKSLQNKYSENQFGSQVEDCISHRRDLLLGISHILNAYGYHIDITVQQAAKKIQGIISKQGELETLSIMDEINAIECICTELKSKHNLLEKLSLEDWVVSLENENKQLLSLLRSRSKEGNILHPDFKTVRFRLDKTYKELIDRIRAFYLLNTDIKYVDFISKLNKNIDHFIKLHEVSHGISKKAYASSSYPEAFY